MSKKECHTSQDEFTEVWSYCSHCENRREQEYHLHTGLFLQLLASKAYQKWGSLSLHGGLFLVVIGVQGGVPKVGLRLGVENGLHLLKHLLQHREV